MIALSLLWAVCGVLGYAITFAVMQRRWPNLATHDYYFDMAFSVIIGMSGPTGLLVVCIIYAIDRRFYGLKWL